MSAQRCINAVCEAIFMQGENCGGFLDLAMIYYGYIS